MSRIQFTATTIGNITRMNASQTAVSSGFDQRDKAFLFGFIWPLVILQREIAYERLLLLQLSGIGGCQGYLCG